MLDDRAAGELHDKGRAWVQMVGRELREVQGPWVSREDFLRALSNGGPSHPMPDLELPADGPTAEQVDQVLEMHEAGESLRAIERAVFGYEGGAAHRQVKELLQVYEGAAPDSTRALRATTATATTGGPEMNENGAEWCEFCSHRSDDPDSAGVDFKQCPSCGVAVCSECTAASGLCPDCEEHDKEHNRDRLR